MANKDEYAAANARIATGKGKQKDYNLAKEAAKQAGSFGNAARDALGKDPKNK